MAKQQVMVLDMMSEVKQLMSLVKERDKKIDDLQRRPDDVELFMRRNDVAISGMEIKHRAYARASSRGHTGRKLPHIALNMCDINVCERFGGKTEPNK